MTDLPVLKMVSVNEIVLLVRKIVSVVTELHVPKMESVKY
jgi:hypothetical protein